MPPNEGVPFRLADHERRLDDLQQELQRARDRIHTLSSLCTSIPDHGRRLTELEELELAVLKADVRHLEKRLDNIAENMATRKDMEHLSKSVGNMSRAMWAAAGTLLVSTVLFLMTVATGQLG